MQVATTITFPSTDTTAYAAYRTTLETAGTSITVTTAEDKTYTSAAVSMPMRIELPPSPVSTALPARCIH